MLEVHRAPRDLTPSYRTVIEPRVHTGADTFVAATYVMLVNGSTATTAANAGFAAVYLDPAEFAVAGLSTKYSVRAACFTNGTAPAITMTVGLYPVTASGGGADANSITLGVVEAGSTVAFASPAVNSRTTSTSGDFTAPEAGYYCLACATSNTPTADSRTTIVASLRARNV